MMWASFPYYGTGSILDKGDYGYTSKSCMKKYSHMLERGKVAYMDLPTEQ